MPSRETDGVAPDLEALGVFPDADALALTVSDGECVAVGVPSDADTLLLWLTEALWVVLGVSDPDSLSLTLLRGKALCWESFLKRSSSRYH